MITSSYICSKSLAWRQPVTAKYSLLSKFSLIVNAAEVCWLLSNQRLFLALIVTTQDESYIKRKSIPIWSRTWMSWLTHQIEGLALAWTSCKPGRMWLTISSVTKGPPLAFLERVNVFCQPMLTSWSETWCHKSLHPSRCHVPRNWISSAYQMHRFA